MHGNYNDYIMSFAPTSVPLLSNYAKEENDSINVVDEDHFSSKCFTNSISKVVEEIKQLYLIALPMILAGLLIYGKSAISMFFMGKLGKPALAGGSLAIGVANITGFSVISGLAAGMEAISSQAFGAAQWRLMGLTLSRTVLILLLAASPLSVLWRNSGPFFLSWCRDADVAAAAASYLAFSVPSLVLQSFINPLRIHLRAQKITKPLMLSAALALAAHAPISYYLVCRLGCGIRAVALAAAASDLITLAVLASYIAVSGVCKPSWPCWSTQCFREWKPILCQGIPSCASVCLEWWWYELMVVFSGLLSNSDEAIASMGILIQATALVYQFPFALNQAASTRVGNELGANRPDKARTSAWVALWCGAVTGLAATGLMAGMKDEWGRIFTKDASIAALVAAVLPVAGLCELGNCPQTAVCGVLRGCSRPTLAACVNLATFYGVGLPVAVVAGFKMGKGLVGLWLGLLTAQAVCAAAMVAVLSNTDWERQAERARELTGGTSTTTTITSTVNINNDNVDNNNNDITETNSQVISTNTNDVEAGLK